MTQLTKYYCIDNNCLIIFLQMQSDCPTPQPLSPILEPPAPASHLPQPHITALKLLESPNDEQRTRTPSIPVGRQKAFKLQQQNQLLAESFSQLNEDYLAVSHENVQLATEICQLEVYSEELRSVLTELIEKVFGFVKDCGKNKDIQQSYREIKNSNLQNKLEMDSVRDFIRVLSENLYDIALKVKECNQEPLINLLEIGLQDQLNQSTEHISNKDFGASLNTSRIEFLIPPLKSSCALSQGKPEQNGSAISNTQSYAHSAHSARSQLQTLKLTVSCQTDSSLTKDIKLLENMVAHLNDELSEKEFVIAQIEQYLQELWKTEAIPQNPLCRETVLQWLNSYDSKIKSLELQKKYLQNCINKILTERELTEEHHREDYHKELQVIQLKQHPDQCILM